MADRQEGETIMLQRYPSAGAYDSVLIENFGNACEAIAGVRNIRQQKNISLKETLELKVRTGFPTEVLPVIEKLANVKVTVTDSFGDTASGVSFMVKTSEFFVPLAGMVDTAEEIARLEAVIAYQEKFLETVRKKLSNEKFVNSAPEKVVAMERKKEADSLAKIAAAEASLKALKGE